MQSGSQSANTSDPFSRTFSRKLANWIGTVIALLTLTLPVMVIVHYSSDSELTPPPSSPARSPLR